MGRILINSLEFRAFHGYFREEQQIGGKYLVDIEIETNFREAATNDRLDGTINYADITNLVGEEMKVKSKLIEHVANRIAEKIMDKFSEIEHVQIKLTKMAPPLKEKVKSVSVIIEKKR